MALFRALRPQKWNVFVLFLFPFRCLFVCSACIVKKCTRYLWKRVLINEKISNEKKNEEEKNENRIPCVLFCVHERLFNLTFYFNRLNWMRMLVSVTNCRLLTKEQSVRAVFDGINICNITYIFLCENCSAVLLCIELFSISKKKHVKRYKSKNRKPYHDFFELRFVSF